MSLRSRKNPKKRVPEVAKVDGNESDEVFFKETNASRNEADSPEIDTGGVSILPNIVVREPRRRAKIQPSIAEEKERVHSRSVHKAHVSLLAPDAPENVSLDGLYNLAGLILVLANARLVLLNIYKYGILLNPLNILTWAGDPYSWPGVTTLVTMPLYGILELYLEKFVYKGYLNETVGYVMSLIVVIMSLFLPSVIVWNSIDNPVVGVVVMVSGVCLSAKLFSYVMVNSEERYLLKKSGRSAPKGDLLETETDRLSLDEQETGPVRYPSNLSHRNMLYFLAAPTLCYQLYYPRSVRIRKRRVIWYTVRGLFCLGFLWVIAEQYMSPLIKNSMEIIVSKNWIITAERLLKLSLPNLYGWILGAYFLFEIWLGTLAEILRFGDRRFYHDWWNARSIPEFWRSWNIPVHKFLLRHVFTPLQNKGYSNKALMVFVFFTSAVFHEIVVSVAFHTIGIWAFLGMMAQPLLVLISKPLNKSIFGNLFFWLTILLGQPLAILMYALNWFDAHPIEGWMYHSSGL